MFDPRPIATTDGGIVDPDDLIGRDAELLALARATGSQGALVTGDRRIGKTSLLRALERDLAEVGHVVVRVSAETSDPAVFGQNLLDALRRQFPPMAKRGSQLTLEGHLDVGPAGIRVVRTSTKESTQSETMDLFAWCSQELRTRPQQRVVFILDEITVLARAMEVTTPGAAMEFLRGLRRTRQDLDGVSMVLAGSIGLHHVVADVSVVNDLSNVSVGQLSVEDADYLAACLLLGERIPVRDLPVVARRLASAASYVPFYIQKLVVALTTRIRSVSADDLDLDELVAEALRADTWQTSHYVTRLPDVFRDPRAAEVAALLLDEIALSDRRSTVDMLAAGLAGRVRPTPTPDLLSTLLLLLQKDHYLRPAGPAWQFATELLRCAWIQHRGL